ncbi:MAG: HD domain-containing protein [Caldilineaceae bacterium]|nr:HD domain-containing protein [Caldilineaceae bacterium]
MIAMLQSASALKRLPRSGWLFAGVAQPESVADHCWATALLAMMLAASVNRDPAAHGLRAPLDIGRVAQIATVHDLAESVVTDLPRRATELLGKHVKHEAEARALAQLTGDLPVSDFLALWQEYSERSTPEGRLVHDADKLEMMHQALAYERAGNQNLGEFWQAYEWHYQVSEEMYAALVTARSAG